jgi:hypothetical protein
MKKPKHNISNQPAGAEHEKKSESIVEGIKKSLNPLYR